MDKRFWSGERVCMTGHTGFKKSGSSLKLPPGSFRLIHRLDTSCFCVVLTELMVTTQGIHESTQSVLES